MNGSAWERLCYLVAKDWVQLWLWLATVTATAKSMTGHCLPKDSLRTALSQAVQGANSKDEGDEEAEQTREHCQE